jgi:hypothetical protein
MFCALKLLWRSVKVEYFRNILAHIGSSCQVETEAVCILSVIVTSYTFTSEIVIHLLLATFTLLSRNVFLGLNVILIYCIQ